MVSSFPACLNIVQYCYAVTGCMLLALPHWTIITLWRDSIFLVTCRSILMQASSRSFCTDMLQMALNTQLLQSTALSLQMSYTSLTVTSTLYLQHPCSILTPHYSQKARCETATETLSAHYVVCDQDCRVGETS